MIDKSLRNSSEFIKLKSSKNCYLFSRFPAMISLVNPELEKEARRLNSSKASEVKPEKFRNYNEFKKQRNEISYYSALCLFLKQHNFFNSISIESLKQFYFFPEDLRSFIASTENIVFEITERCNLRCVYCGYGELYNESDNRGEKDLQFLLAKNLIDYILSQREKNGISNPLSISFYGGEPLLNFNLIEQIIDYIKESDTAIDKKLIKFRITTNGLKLEKYIDKLINNNIYVTISLDGDRIHNRYRILANGEESFDLIYPQILILKQKNPEYFNTHVSFNSIITDFSNLKEIECFFGEKFNKPLKISELSPVGVKKGKYIQFQKMYRSTSQILRDSIALNKHIEKHPVSLRLFNLLVSHSNNFIFSSKIKKPEDKRKFKVRTGTCKPFRRKIFCTVDGNLLSCEKIPRNFSIAKVTEACVEIDYELLCEKFRNWNTFIADMCMSCQDNLNCLNCFFFIDLSKEKPECNRFCNKAIYIKNIVKTLELLESNPGIYKQLFESK